MAHHHHHINQSACGAERGHGRAEQSGLHDALLITALALSYSLCALCAACKLDQHQQTLGVPAGSYVQHHPPWARTAGSFQRAGYLQLQVGCPDAVQWHRIPCLT